MIRESIDSNMHSVAEIDYNLSDDEDEYLDQHHEDILKLSPSPTKNNSKLQSSNVVEANNIQ